MNINKNDNNRIYVKFIGTIIGFCFALIGIMALIFDEMMIFSAASFISFIPIALPLELIGSIFLHNYTTKSFFVLFILLILLGITSFYFFKYLIKDKNDNNPLNYHRLFLYFGLQLVILHPLVFYFWAFTNSSNSRDGQFMLGIIITFPISSIFFLIIGIIIDLVKFEKKSHKIINNIKN